MEVGGEVEGRRGSFLVGSATIHPYTWGKDSRYGIGIALTRDAGWIGVEMGVKGACGIGEYVVSRDK